MPKLSWWNTSMGVMEGAFEADGASEARQQILLEAIPAIIAVENEQDLLLCLEKYGQLNHPAIQYTLAGQCLLLRLDADAVKHFILGAKPGLTPGGPYYYTPYAALIGHCLTMLLTRFEYTDLAFKNATLFNMTVLAYLCFSRCIALFNEKEHIHRLGRLSLLKDMVEPGVRARFYDGVLKRHAEVLCKIADLVPVAQGYRDTEPAIQEEYNLQAISLHKALKNTLINSVPANCYSLSELAAIGEKLHKKAFAAFEERFLKGQYNLTEEEISKVVF